MMLLSHSYPRHHDRLSPCSWFFSAFHLHHLYQMVCVTSWLLNSHYMNSALQTVWFSLFLDLLQVHSAVLAVELDMARQICYRKPLIFLPNKILCINKKKYRSKKRLPQFLYCHYICMYVSVIATAYTVCASKLKFELGSLYMIISKCIFLFFEILFYFGVVPVFPFFTIFDISRV